MAPQMVLGHGEGAGGSKALLEHCHGALNWVSVFTGKLKTDCLEHHGEMTSSSLSARDEKTKSVVNKNTRNPVSEPIHSCLRTVFVRLHFSCVYKITWSLWSARQRKKLSLVSLHSSEILNSHSCPSEGQGSEFHNMPRDGGQSDASLKCGVSSTFLLHLQELHARVFFLFVCFLV